MYHLEHGFKNNKIQRKINNCALYTLSQWQKRMHILLVYKTKYRIIYKIKHSASIWNKIGCFVFCGYCSPNNSCLNCQF